MYRRSRNFAGSGISRKSINRIFCDELLTEKVKQILCEKGRIENQQKKYIGKKQGNFARIDQERRVTADGMLITELFIKMHR